jgi:uncharacterized protein (TIGR00255 family)
MIKSMTGYGKAAAAAGTKKITVEVRSLNSKQLDLAVKMPSAWRGAEYDVRTRVATAVGRGKVDVYFSVEDSAGAGGVSVNAAVFGGYYRQIVEAARAAGFSIPDGGELAAAILRLPDVMAQSEVVEVTEEEAGALKSALGEALAAFDAFRAQEGAVLLTDILGRVEAIGALLRRVEPFERARVDAVRARIMEHIASLGVAADANRLEQEIVFWVEKLDITEEKVRLTKHCDYFREVAGAEESEAGRKLGFIAQEMGREINTLGSKANDAEIQKLVVQMKDELEKIKEQLLNIL